ncbi:MAG: hypothetical protein HY694_05405 [Deltaproteobacteria bacterium]|nr:hypothetical protein [Deltaproteobacteria bacterium]
MKKIRFLSTMVVASFIVVSTSGAEVGWRPSPFSWGKGLYHGGGAVRDAKRNDPFGAIDHLLRIPNPMNPYRFLPKDEVMKSFRKVDPARRYGPEFQDLFR